MCRLPAFWSLTIYDTATRSMLQNQSGDAAHSSYDNLKTNADRSIELYFAATAPAGLESNWVEPVPGKGFSGRRKPPLLSNRTGSSQNSAVPSSRFTWT
jgi:hypothetical protein